MPSTSNHEDIAWKQLDKHKELENQAENTDIQLDGGIPETQDSEQHQTIENKTTSSGDFENLKLFIGQIPRDLDEDGLQGILGKYGKIRELVVLRDRHGLSRGCAFCTFSNIEEANQAVNELHQKVTLDGMGNALQVKFADVATEKPENKLFVGMIPLHVAEVDLKQIFSQFGQIKEVALLRNSSTGVSRGCAFIKFVERSSAEAAVEAVNGKMRLTGSKQPLVVKFAYSGREKQLMRAKQQQENAQVKRDRQNQRNRARHNSMGSVGMHGMPVVGNHHVKPGQYSQMMHNMYAPNHMNSVLKGKSASLGTYPLPPSPLLPSFSSRGEHVPIPQQGSLNGRNMVMHGNVPVGASSMPVNMNMHQYPGNNNSFAGNQNGMPFANGQNPPVDPYVHQYSNQQQTPPQQQYPSGNSYDDPFREPGSPFRSPAGYYGNRNQSSSLPNEFQHQGDSSMQYLFNNNIGQNQAFDNNGQQQMYNHSYNLSTSSSTASASSSNSTNRVGYDDKSGSPHLGATQDTGVFDPSAEAFSSSWNPISFANDNDAPSGSGFDSNPASLNNTPQLRPWSNSEASSDQIKKLQQSFSDLFSRDSNAAVENDSFSFALFNSNANDSLAGSPGDNSSVFSGGMNEFMRQNSISSKHDAGSVPNEPNFDPVIGLPPKVPQTFAGVVQQQHQIPTDVPYHVPMDPGADAFGGSYSSVGTPPDMATYMSMQNAPMQNKPQSTGPKGANLFVFNLPRHFAEADMQKMFQPFGRILSATVFIDKVSGRSKCFGFVSFSDAGAAQNAIKAMNGAEVFGKKLKVQLKREADE